MELIDSKYGVRRYLAEYSTGTDELVEEYELNEFDLVKFRKQFNVSDSTNPMFDSFSVSEKDTEFLKSYLGAAVEWRFESSEYFLEAHAL